MVRPYRLDAWTAAAPDADPVAFHAAGLVTEPAAVRARADPRPAARFRLETLRGALEVAVPPEAYADAAPLLAEGALLAVGGTVRRAADGWRAELQRAGRLDELAARHTRRVRLHVAAALGQPETLERIAAALERHRGLVPVEIALEQPDGSRAVLRVGRDLTVAVTEELVRAVEALLGEEAFYAEAELPAPRGGATGESSSQTSIMR
jgi:DNA polymerase III alpha subunit